jgi:hypothetical protein
MSYVATPTRTFANNAALAKHLRVKLSSGYLAAAGAADKELGTMEYASLSTDEAACVRLRTAEGTQPFIAAGAIAAGAAVYTAASGKVNDDQAAGAFALGTALTAASGDGSIIEVLLNVHGDTAGS